MIKSHLKIALRNFRKQIGYSLIKVFGLSISIACCILMFMWVQHELSFDRHLPDAERIYRVGYYGVVQGNTVHGVQACPTMAPVLNTDFPEVEAATRFRRLGNPVIRYGEKVFSEESWFAADPNFFEVFQLTFLAGNPGTALNKPQSVVISQSTALKYFGEENPVGRYLDKVFSEERWYAGDENFFAVFQLTFLAGNPQRALTKPNSLVINQSTALKYFGDENPVGKILQTDNRRDWRITGVVEDMPENAHFHFDFLASMNSYRNMGTEATWLSNIRRRGGPTW